MADLGAGRGRKFFEGMVVFMTGVALPLVSKEFGLGAFEHGIVAAAGLFGILLGATALGGLADRYGRKRMFILELVLFAVFLALVCVSPSFPWFVPCLLGMGIGLGADYPTAHIIISEAIPSRSRGRLVLSAFGFQALGALFGTGIGWLVVSAAPEVEAWRWMYASAIVPAVLVLAGRLFISESVPWLMAHDRVAEAEAHARRLLRRRPEYPRAIRLKPSRSERAGVVHRRRPGQGPGLGPAVAVRAEEPARHPAGLRALVPAGPQHLRHRHLHAHDPGEPQRSPAAARAQRGRHHPQRSPDPRAAPPPSTCC